MQEYLGRPLLSTETVHHKNGKRDDNRLKNLELRFGQHGSGQAIVDIISEIEAKLTFLDGKEKTRTIKVIEDVFGIN
jgi:hypothetical protein